MPASTRRRVVALALASVLSACGNGGSSPTRPEMPPVTIPTGPQVLRINLSGPCPAPETPRGGFLPLVYTRVMVSHSGSEWVATAASADAGTVELRFHQAGAVVIPGSMPIQGTIRGVAVHFPELLPALPTSTARATIGPDTAATVIGFSSSPSSLTPSGGTTGLASGSIMFSDNGANACAGTNFSWALGSQG